MIDFFSLFKTIFIFLLLFGVELFGFFQGVSYYKTGKLFFSLDMPGGSSSNFGIAFIGFVMGSILFLGFNILFLGAILTNLPTGLILLFIHNLAVYLILRWYLKRIGFNTKEDTTKI